MLQVLLDYKGLLVWQGQPVQMALQVPRGQPVLQGLQVLMEPQEL